MIKISDSRNICFVFDVDGTLTEPREEITNEMFNLFSSWSKNKQCFISTGSDFEKTKEQIGQKTLNCFDLIFCCMGNETRIPNGEIIRRVNFILEDELKADLDNFLLKSDFFYRTGTHLEPRTGMINFSIIGRDATSKQRREYFEWDKKEKEREAMVSFINNKYSGIEASIGGSISIDIIKKGYDKGQIVHVLQEMGAKKLVYVGDRCFPGGNDYGVIRELRKSDLAFEWYNVSGPKDTLELIRENAIFQEVKYNEKIIT